MFEDSENNAPLVTITRLGGNDTVENDLSNIDFGDLPVLPTRNLILFPDVTAPIGLSRDVTKTIAETASRKNILIGVICQRDPEAEDPELKDLDKYGVIARVINVVKLPNGTSTAIIHALSKFRVTGRGTGKTMPEAPISVTIRPIKDRLPRKNDQEFSAMVNAIKEASIKLVEKNGDVASLEMSMNLRNIDDPTILVNMIACMFPFDHDFKLHLLTLHRVKDRAFEILTELSKQEQMLELTEVIKSKARKGIEEHQRNAFLQEQLDAIKEELYGADNDDVISLESKEKNINLPEAAKKIFDKELEKLKRTNSQSPDYAVLYNYLELLLSLPWNKRTEFTNDFKTAKEVLDTDHYGLEKVKERILEQIAVILHRPESKAPIICLIGAPGVGKTSLGKSIARALGRNYQRVSLGGVHDEAEIRGHRRTYIGSMPGRIIDAMKKAESNNPVLLLDEIDKLGSDYKGDPSSALLEVLDPEQNNRFHDNYVDVDFDLSKVLFIATANTLSTIPQPLLDRMEIIDIQGYVEEEKIEIAKRHLLPKIIEELDISAIVPDIEDGAIQMIIENYTSESGVRQLEKNLASVMRKLLMNHMNKTKIPKNLSPSDIKNLLGVPLFNKERYDNNDFAGVVTGLAWTSAGGEILFIETSLIPGKGEKLTITGNLGDVMKESATLALQYVRSHSSSLGIPSDRFEKFNIHIHVPEGAVPKDGPSAGITIVTSLVSALKQVKVKKNLAMTGEITLRGKVLPVGGIKEKILAAKRAGIKTIILSKENQKNVEDIPAIYLKGLNFEYCNTIDDVLKLSLTEERPNHSINFD